MEHLDQATNLRNIVKNSQVANRRRAKVITVTSGKGGVGKSNISVNLAIQLRKMGKSVIVFDADFGLANVEVIFGVIPKYNLFDVIYNNKTITEVLTNGPLGIEFLSGGSGVKELLRLDKTQIELLVTKLAELDRYADVIIIDTGAGISDAVLSFLSASHEVILVTTPEPTSVTDAYAVLKAIRNNKIDEIEGHIHVLVNRVRSDKEGREIFDKLNKVSQKFLNIELRTIGYLPEDRFLPRAVIEQKPISILYPKANIVKSFEELSTKIMEDYDEEEKTTRGLGNIFTNFLRHKDRR